MLISAYNKFNPKGSLFHFTFALQRIIFLGVEQEEGAPNYEFSSNKL